MSSYEPTPLKEIHAILGILENAWNTGDRSALQSLCAATSRVIDSGGDFHTGESILTGTFAALLGISSTFYCRLIIEHTLFLMSDVAYAAVKIHIRHNVDNVSVETTQRCIIILEHGGQELSWQVVLLHIFPQTK